MSPSALVILDIIIELLRLVQRAEVGEEVTEEQIADVFAKADLAEKEWEDAGTAEG